MTKVHLNGIGFLRGRRLTRFSGLSLAVGVLGLGMLTSASAQTSVRSFGARCDGSDDSGAINSALQSLSNGGTLQLNCNMGVGSSYLKLQSKQGVTLDGAGGSLTSLSGNSDHVLLLVESCDSCSVRNLTINGNNAGVEGIYIRFSSNSTVENNTISNITLPGAAGIIAMGNRGNRYLNNTVSNTSGPAGDGPRGIWIGNAATNLLDRSATVNNNNIHDISATGLVLQVVGATASGNQVDRTQGAGIKVESTPGQGGEITVENNTVRNAAWHGLQLNQVDVPVYIRNNTITSNTISGIYSTSGSFPGGQISGNTISNNGQANLYLYAASNVTIQNNQITGGGVGIIFEANSSSILGNVQINSNNISNANEDGIVARGRGGSFSGLSVSSNSIVNNGRYGMSIEETNNGAISNVSLNNNCFSGNRQGALLDIRNSNRLSVSTSSGCSAASGGATTSNSSSGASSSTSSSSTTPPPASTPPPSTSTDTASTGGSSGGNAVIRVNCGGGQYTDPSGNVWAADTGASGGNTYTVGNGIANTNTATIYQSHRWNRGTLDYTFQVPSGARTVTLKFAETYWGRAGQRLFSVWINGQQVLSDFDIYASAGVLNAIDRSFQVQSNGQVTIHMVSSVDAALISGIEIK